jgi:hypothetical protein
MPVDNGFWDFYTMGSEIVISTVDDEGHDHEEIAVVWVRTGQLIITNNGRIITPSSELKIKATKVKFPVFTVSKDAVQVYQNMKRGGFYENFDSRPE